jgi:hypothetical protein
MKSIKSFASLALAGGLLFASSANSAVIATLSFDTPSATIASNADVPVWLTLTLDPSSDPITTDASSNVTSPLSPQVVSDLGGHTTGVVVNEEAFCGTGLDGCNGPGAPYTFSFNYGANNFVTPANLNLQPGDSLDFLLGTFTPNGGNAAPGVYSFSNAGIIFQYYDGSDPNNIQNYSSDIADACPSFTASCAFTRTVLGTAAGAVPEPASWALMMIGLGGLGAALRARRRPEGVTPSAA